jgi:hypothetical protein
MADQADNAAEFADGLRRSQPNDIGNVQVNKNPREPSATLKRLIIGRLQTTFPKLGRSILASGKDDFGQDRFSTIGGREGPGVSLRTTAKKGEQNGWTNTSRAQIDEYAHNDVVLLVLLWAGEFVWAYCIPPELLGLRDAMSPGDNDVSLRVGPNASGQLTVRVGGYELPLDDKYTAKIALAAWEQERLDAASVRGDEIGRKVDKLVAKSERQMISRLARPQQAKFKRRLLKWYGSSCQISRGILSCVVHACHIDRKADGSSDEPDNGFLLRADIHILYDANLIGIQPETFEVAINKYALAGTEYADFENHNVFADAVHAHRPNADAMQRRWKAFQDTLEEFAALTVA